MRQMRLWWCIIIFENLFEPMEEKKNNPKKSTSFRLGYMLLSCYRVMSLPPSEFLDTAKHGSHDSSCSSRGFSFVARHLRSVRLHHLVWSTSLDARISGVVRLFLIE